MNEREHRRPLIVESWDGGDPLDAFALERPKTPNPPLPVTASPDDREVAVGFTEPRITRPTRRPTAVMVGVAGLAGVAAATIVVLSMYVGSMPPVDKVTTVANRSDSDAPVQLESTGQIAEEEAVPKAVDLSPRAPDPPAEPPVQTRAATRVEPEPVKIAVPPPLTETRIVGTTGPPAPIAGPAPRTAVQPIVTSTPPPPSSPAAPPPSAPSLLTTGAVIAAPSVATAPTPSAVVTTAPSNTVTSAPANTVAAAPSGAVTAATPGNAGAQSAVLAVLHRYAAAFSALDVQQVKVIWPQVNQDALKRAFSALQEQKFDLGNCDVWITGASAVASCAGRAAYTPKVGNRTRRSEAREWTFYLDQDDLWWSIASVKTR